MKTKHIWITLLILAMFFSVSAHAEYGTKSIIYRGELADKYDDYIRGGCVIDDTLYLYGSKHFFIYKNGDDRFETLKYDIPSIGEEESFYIEAIFSRKDRLYGLVQVQNPSDNFNFVRMETVEITIENDSVRFENAFDIDVENFIASRDGEDLYLPPINTAIGTDNYLYLCVEKDREGTAIYVFDFINGEGLIIDAPGIQRITRWENNSILIATYDNSEGLGTFLIYEPTSKSLSSACNPVPMNSPAYGLSYSSETGRLYYLEGDQLMAVSDLDFKNAETVSAVSVMYCAETVGMLLPEDLYVYVDDESAAICGTQSDAIPQKHLSIVGLLNSGVAANAYNDFTRDHNNISVEFGAQGPAGPIVDAMLNRDSSVDIYVLGVHKEDYAALLYRGYMVELENVKLVNAVSKMYPSIQNTVVRDGMLMALPIDVSGWTIGLDYNGFEKIGVSREDIPTCWSDFLDFLSVLPERLPDDGRVCIFENNYSASNVRKSLIRTILDCWRWYRNADGQELGYDDPELQTLLNKVLALDLVSMGLIERTGENYDVSLIEEENDEITTLVKLNIGCTIGNFYSDAEPSPLSILPGYPAQLPIQLSVAFVNPYSQNVDLAIEFLVDLFINLDIATRYNMSSEASEAVRNRDYDRSLAELQTALEDSYAQLEKAAPLDKPMWEDRIAQYQQQIEHLKQNGWDINPGEIEWYRAHTDNLIVNGYDCSTEAYNNTIDALIDGQIDVSNFLKNIDHAARMREKEGV